MSDVTNLDRLPVEIIQAILRFLPDLKSLKAVARTSKSLLNAVNDAKEVLATNVITNQISPDLLPEALLALESARLGSDDKKEQEIVAFTSKYLPNRLSILRQVSLQEATEMARLHDAVQYFSDSCSKKSLSFWSALSHIKAPFLEGLPDMPDVPLAPSEREWNRFARAFYRLELYCNLYGHLSEFEIEGQPRSTAPLNDEYFSLLWAQQKSFFRFFSHWETMQLDVVRIFLLSSLLRPALMQAAQTHPSLWGSIIIGDEDLAHHLFKMKLVNLHSVANRGVEQLLELVKQPRSVTYSSGIFLKSPLTQADFVMVLHAKESLDFDKLSDADDFYVEYDKGPMEFWRYAMKTQAEFWNQTPDIPQVPGFEFDRGMIIGEMFKHMAYVMWDAARLQPLESEEKRAVRLVDGSESEI